jgi:hypothetical protein
MLLMRGQTALTWWHSIQLKVKVIRSRAARAHEPGQVLEALGLRIGGIRILSARARAVGSIVEFSHPV